MRSGKARIFLGISFIVIFITVLVLLNGLYRYGDASVSGALSRFYGYFRSFTTRLYKGPKTLIRQEVVQQESSVIDVVAKVSPSVVSVLVETVDFDLFSGPSVSESGVGTGFIVDASGLIVTNSHVVDNPAGEYSVILKDGSTYDVTKVHADDTSDIAILEITARDLPVVELGDSNELRVGQTAIAIGNALGRFQNTVTVGVVSGIARELMASSPFGATKAYENVIQTDAALNPGNSGGPLLNSAGQVIGINVATTVGADNIGFAIPVNTLKPVLESFLKQGRIVKPYIGVTYTMVTKDIAALRRMPEGAFVSGVVPGSPAEKAGLQRGDILVKYNDISLSSETSLSKVIAQSEVGDTVTLRVDRNGNELVVTLTLEEAPADR